MKSLMDDWRDLLSYKKQVCLRAAVALRALTHFTT